MTFTFLVTKLLHGNRQLAKLCFATLIAERKGLWELVPNGADKEKRELLMI
jgi:hypothetical protein